MGTKKAVRLTSEKYAAGGLRGGTLPPRSASSSRLEVRGMAYDGDTSMQ